MKTFLAGKNKTLDRRSAMALAGINLLATPGLGTIMAGRLIVGCVQLAAAGAGFLLLMKWFYGMFRGMLDENAHVPAWQWQAGLALFAAGWLGSLWSSLNIVRSVAVETPPKLDGSPG
jgi:hypothetical protein